MTSFTFKGFITPVVSTFKDDLSINLDVINDYAQFLANAKIKGVLVNGTTGEGMLLSVEERKLIAEWAKACKKTKVHLMVQIGGLPLPHVLELASHAESVGVDSILCLPELYYRPTNSESLIKYLKTVSEAAPKTPLLYYHNPNMTNVNIHMGHFLNDVDGKIPTFHGIKFTSNALDEGLEVIKASKNKYTIFLGSNVLMAAGFAAGFDSAIGSISNLFPQLTLRILEAVTESKIEEARKIQDVLNQVTSEICKYGARVPAFKVAMNLLTPIKVGKSREPFENITVEKIEKMENALKKVLNDNIVSFTTH